MKRTNHWRNQQRRAADRWHACEVCGDVYGCDECSEALTKSLRRVVSGRNRSDGSDSIALYSRSGWVHPFLCDQCRKKRKRSA